MTVTMEPITEEDTQRLVTPACQTDSVETLPPPRRSSIPKGQLHITADKRLRFDSRHNSVVSGSGTTSSTNSAEKPNGSFDHGLSLSAWCCGMKVGRNQNAITPGRCRFVRFDTWKRVH